VNRKDLQELSNIRLKEAKALLDLGMSDGAYYLAGYAVECGLKACIAKGTQRHDFPDKKRADLSYTHSLRELVRVAGLEGLRLKRAGESQLFDNNWEAVDKWSERSRYERKTPEAAKRMVDAVSNRRDGVISWIKLFW
jgi:HEPN domain-containing protein